MDGYEVAKVQRFFGSASIGGARRVGLAVLLACAGLVGTPGRLDSHEVPARVTVLAFLRPEGSVLRLVIRTPLEAMRDFEPPIRGPGYLQISQSQSLIVEAARIWIADYLRVLEGERTLHSPAITAAKISLPSDRSFVGYESALSHALGPPLPDEIDIPWQQAMLDVVLEFGIDSATSTFSIDPMLAHLGVETTTILRFKPPGSPERVFRYTGNPGIVRLDPSWTQAAAQFVRLGFEHILDGIDHLLFVFCLVIPFRRLRSLIAIVTSFTVAHSITMVAAVAGFAPSGLWFPPLIETLIALSIVYMALENVVGPKLERRWLIAFGFGLVHGFGFSFGLRDSLQFAGSHLAFSLVAFNVGVELGQVAVILLAVPLLGWLFRRVVDERMGTILLSALVAHTAWHWMLERGAELRQYQFTWPAFDRVFLAGTLRAMMLLLIVGGAMWALHALVTRLGAASRPKGAEPAPPDLTAPASDPL
jgi:hypothetical protein